ncbi:helix-turn-helix transcriptional regulator [Aeromicrobium sp. A1-2]|uniref:helix-turn-helix transcriptional regulator n=1 Tax=Aeromicrobium sp. A1-2 TaxID=2107713 RepID=UPI0013C2A598|nr:helix-turn-helix transcriptional regulator [Aeromicrobium sp. A1-2]
MTSDDMATAATAMQAGRWAEAVTAFGRVITETDDPWAHDGLAQAGWWIDDADMALVSREAAYRGFRAVGDDRAAGRAAATLGYDSILFGRGVAVGRGWLARSVDLLAGRPDAPEAGWLAVRLAEVSLHADHDARTGLQHARVAEEIGRATGDHDLTFVGQGLAGLALVRLGRVAEGMALLDGAAGAATAGDVDDLMWMGKICCWLINACQEAGDLTRASTWCSRVEEICRRQDLAPLFSVCRIQYASVQMAQGDCVGAESTLEDVMAQLESSKRSARLEAVAQLGELRRRQGRYAEAEILLEQAGFHPGAVISLTRLRLEEGDATQAWSTVSELLRALPDDHQLERAEVLAAVVEAGAAAGEIEPARRAVAELRQTADRVCTEAVLAIAAAAEARIADRSAAQAAWQDAIRHSVAAGLPFDEADHRLDLAEILVDTGAIKEARHQAALALERVLPLGDGLAIARARTILGGAATGVPLTERQIEVLRLVARGLSNAEIATELVLSEHTVHRHIANIYDSLDIRSRAAAAAYAVGQGLG